MTSSLGLVLDCVDPPHRNIATDGTPTDVL